MQSWLDYRIDFERPEYLLLLLLLLPLVWGMAWRPLTAIGRWRSAVALLLRTAMVLLLVGALAELRLVRKADSVSVLYLVDRSASVSPEQSAAVLDWINRDAAAGFRPGKDRWGVVAFARDAAIELPCASTPVGLARFETSVSRSDTNLAAALRLARAAFPSEGARRVVVLSDGNQTLGHALAEARTLAEAGIGIDVVPIATGRGEDVAVEKVVAPPSLPRGAPFDVRVVLDATGQGRGSTGDSPEGAEPISGRLYVTRITGQRRETIADEALTLTPGKRVLSLRQQLELPDFYTYEARFVPDDPARDAIARNNVAYSFAHVRGQGQVLLIEDFAQAGRFDELVTRLRAAELEVDVRRSDQLFGSLAELQRYDVVVLADVPRVSGEGEADLTAFTDEQVELLVRNTQELGGGLVVLGGPNSFGPGGWANTELEQALPIDFQVKNLKVVPSGALMLVIDKSGSMSGEKLSMSKAAAVAAVRVLGERDQVGVIAFDSEAERVVPLQPIRSHQPVIARIDRIASGGGTNLYPGAADGYRALRGANAAIKHMIILSDGHTEGSGYQQLATQMRQLKITTSCVAIGPDADGQLMRQIANAGGGKFYQVNNPRLVPRIFAKEARRVARPQIFEDQQGIPLEMSGGHEVLRGIDPPLLPITGYVLSTVKDSPLVELAVTAPRPAGATNAVLASWSYGAGRALVWTTDAGQRWAASWSGWESYDKLFTQMMRWAMRSAADDSQFMLFTSVEGDEVLVTLNALAEDEDSFANFLAVSGSVIGPDLSSSPLALEQVAPGRYVGRFQAGQEGSYFLSLATGPGRAPLRAGVSVPYSPEFKAATTNRPLLESLASLTPRGGSPGRVHDVLGANLADDARRADLFRRDLTEVAAQSPSWHWLLLAAGVLLLADVANRRIALSLAWLPPLVARVRARLGARAVEAAPVEARLSQLRAGKLAVDRQIEARRAATRFEPGGELPPDSGDEVEAATAAVATAPREAPTLGPPSAPDEPPAESYTSRLLRAKRQVWEERGD